MKLKIGDIIKQKQGEFEIIEVNKEQSTVLVKDEDGNKKLLWIKDVEIIDDFDTDIGSICHRGG